jgi:hypothetical protein
MSQSELDSGGETLKFHNHFWDEQLSGFEVLSQNVRNSMATVKEFELFLKESANNEGKNNKKTTFSKRSLKIYFIKQKKIDQYVKSINKTLAQFEKFNTMENTVEPIVNDCLKEINRKNSAAHLHAMHEYYELINELQSYYGNLKKNKRKTKTLRSNMDTLAEALRDCKIKLIKLREQYFQIKNDIQQAQSDTSTLATVRKLEKKMNLIYNDCVVTTDKYNSIRNDYINFFTMACDVFEEEEEMHLKKMTLFFQNYAQILSHLNGKREANLNLYQSKLTSYTTQCLLKIFVNNRNQTMKRSTSTDLMPQHVTIDRDGPNLFKNFPDFNSTSSHSRLKGRVTSPIYMSTLSTTNSLKSVDPFDSSKFSFLFLKLNFI